MDPSIENFDFYKEDDSEKEIFLTNQDYREKDEDQKKNSFQINKSNDKFLNSKRKNNETLFTTNNSTLCNKSDSENEISNQSKSSVIIILDRENEYKKRKEEKNKMVNGNNIGKNKNKKNLKRKDVIAKHIKSNIQTDIHTVIKPYLTKNEKLEKISYKFIENDSGFINRIIFLKTIKEFLLLNEKNRDLIEKLENRAKNNDFLFLLLNMTYIDFIYEIFINPNNEFGIDNSKYKIQKELYNDEKKGFIKYYYYKKDRQLQLDPERDRILGIRPKNIKV